MKYNKKTQKILAILLISITLIFAVTPPAYAIAPALAGEALWTAITMLEGQRVYYNTMDNATEGATKWYNQLSDTEKTNFVNSIQNAVNLGADYIYIDPVTGQYFPLYNDIYDDLQRYKINTDRIQHLLTGGYKLTTYYNNVQNGLDVGSYIKNSSNIVIAGQEYIPITPSNPQGPEYWYNLALQETFSQFSSITGRAYNSNDITGLPYTLDVPETYDEFGTKLGRPYIPDANENKPLDKYIPIPKTLAEAEQHLNVTNDSTQTYPKITTGKLVYNPDTQKTTTYSEPITGQIPTEAPTTETGFWGAVLNGLKAIETSVTNVWTSVTSLATSITNAFSTTASPDVTINWEPLKLTANTFTNKFPFSLPWDLYRMLQSIDKGSGTTPIYEGIWNGVNVKFDFSTFDSIIDIARAMEIIGFNIGLVVATRRYLGGAT